jgi:hypothetical protein
MQFPVGWGCRDRAVLYDYGMGLEAVNSKFNWARHHFELFERELREHMKVDPNKFVREPEVSTDKDGRMWVYGRFEAAQAIPDAIPHILGDCLGNLRSTLDYLIWELVRANGNDPTEKNAFPVAITSKNYRNQLDRGILNGVSPEAAATVEQFQPYHVGSNAESSLIYVLNKFANINKHRRILLTRTRTALPPPDLQVVDGEPFAMMNPPVADRDARFGPFEVIDGKYQLNTKVIAYIVFDEAPAQDFEIYSLVERIAAFLNDEVFPSFEIYL